MKKILMLLLVVVATLRFNGLTQAVDWPQLQANAARTGRTTDSVTPPFRARWIWCGPTTTLRNRESVAGWPDNLTPSNGYSYAMPAVSSVTIAESVQPVLAGGKLFVGTLEGKAFAINADDGATLWTGAIPGGTIAAAAVAGDIAVFVSLSGKVYGLRTADGTQAWLYSCAKAVTGAPCLSGATVFVADHAGYVYALNATTGTLLWKSSRLPAPVVGGLAADGNTIYAGAENMYLYALNSSDGTVRASRRVRGQTFRMVWPMLFNGKVWVTSGRTPHLGSEYVGEVNQGSSLFSDGASADNEQDNILRWLNGDTNNGRWPEASPDWRYLYALNATDLAEPFVAPAAPVDGVGAITHPPVVDNANRVLTYFKTKYPTLTREIGGVFGTAFSVDISAVDQTTGRRIPINNGTLSHPWPWEIDNLYGMTVAGSHLWLRQNFRGTQMINLATSSSHAVSAQVRYWDGGNFSQYNIIYKDQPPPFTSAQNGMLGRIGPIVVGNRAYIAETYAITAIESKP